MRSSRNRIVSSRWNRGKPRITFASHVPAFGVRLNPGFKPGNERHSLGDHGRRGAPIVVLLVPVALQKGRYRPVGDLSENVAWRAARPVSPGKERTRFTFDLAGYTPPATASGVLVLLMYNLSAEFAPASPGSSGGSLKELAADIEIKAPARNGPAHVFIQRLVEGMAESVEDAFKNTDQHRPRPGRSCAPRATPECVAAAAAHPKLRACKLPVSRRAVRPYSAWRATGFASRSWRRFLSALARCARGPSGRPGARISHPGR